MSEALYLQVYLFDDISARSKLKGSGRGFKGAISALLLSMPTSLHNDGTLAAGARTWQVAHLRRTVWFRNHHVLIAGNR
jgi:hypothetical protein